PSDTAQHGIPDITVFPGHGARLDAALKAVAHDQVVAFAQFLDESWNVPEVVAGIGVGHDHVAPVSGGDASHECAAVAFLWNADHAGPQGGGNRLRAVSTAVVSDDDLAGNAAFAERVLRFLDADRQRFGLVQARHYHADFG